jgi:hypothetical protein
MDLHQKLKDLTEEKAQQLIAEDKAHARVIQLNRLIKATENLIKDAEEVFKEETESVFSNGKE